MTKLIKAATVRELCGDVSDMTVWRWLNDPTLNFPKPVRIQSKRYWRENDIAAWLESRDAA